jgi:transposase
MPRALPLPLREQIVELHAKGCSFVEVARALPVKERTAREIWRRYREAGRRGLQTHYAQCGRPGIRFPAALHEAALALKRQHPSWGAGFLRLELAPQFPGERLPGERTLQQWWRDAGLQPARAKRPPLERERAQKVHEVWEMDAKERMRLADGSGTSTLTVTDEASGALLGVEPFPPLLLDASRTREGPSRGTEAL